MRSSYLSHFVCFASAVLLGFASLLLIHNPSSIYAYMAL